jgi:hypothetical protein
MTLSPETQRALSDTAKTPAAREVNARADRVSEQAAQLHVSPRAHDAAVRAVEQEEWIPNNQGGSARGSYPTSKNS